MAARVRDAFFDLNGLEKREEEEKEANSGTTYEIKCGCDVPEKGCKTRKPEQEFRGAGVYRRREGEGCLTVSLMTFHCYEVGNKIIAAGQDITNSHCIVNMVLVTITNDSSRKQILKIQQI